MVAVYAKLLYEGGWKPLHLYFATLVVMSLVLIVHEVIALERGERWGMSRQDVLGTIASTITGGVLDPLLFFMGLQFVKASESIILTSLSPFFTVLLAIPFLHEHLTRQVAFGGFFLTLGLLSLLWKDLTSLTLSPGVPLLLASSFLAALTTIIHKKYVVHRHLDSIVLVRTLLTTTVIGTAVFLTGPEGFRVLTEPNNPLLFLALPLFGFLVPFFLFFNALRKIPAVETGILAAMGRVIGIILASTLLGETLGLPHLLSIICIALGMLLVNVPLTRWRIVPSRLPEIGPLKK